MKTLNISAGGKNTRAKDFLNQEFEGIPKHLLPIPELNTSLVDCILWRSYPHFQDIIVWASEENIESLTQLTDRYDKIRCMVDGHMSGPLGPLIRDTTDRSTIERSFGCAGDHYCEFDWTGMLKFHDSHNYPATILTAKSAAFTDAATFIRQTDGRITAWQRKEISEEIDLINVGCYIFDHDPVLVELLAGITYHKEGRVFDALIGEGLLAGYDPGVSGFNINTAETYDQLLKYLANGSR